MAARIFVGLKRRTREGRARRMATAFAEFCKEFLISGSPMTVRPRKRA